MKKILLLGFMLVASVLPAQKKNAAKLPDAPEPKPTSAAERMAGLEKRKQAEARSLVSNIGFRNVGPTIMSGRVVDLDVNPNDPTHFYVAYASGGLFFTDNNGITFRPVFENEEAITIGDIAVDWTNPSATKIWVGTGENNSSRSSYSGTGLYYSSNSGKTWEKRGLEESHHIGKILIHPTNPNTVWVAVIGHLYSPSQDRGVYKTTDGGKSWKKTLFINENTGVIDLFINPDNANIVYACAWHRERRAWNFVESGVGSGIHVSSDGGDSWNLLSVAASGFPQGEGVGRIGLSIFPSNTNIMYAIVDNQSVRESKAGSSEAKALKAADFKTMTRDAFLKLDHDLLEAYLRENEFPAEHTAQTIMQLVQDNKLQPISLADYVYDANADLFSKPIIGAEVYRSEDAGKTWKKTNDKDIKNLFYTYGYYFGKIWVSPSNVDEIFIAGVSLLKSSDGGKTFQPVDGANQHGDHHALWINPKRAGHLINGNDGGVNISWDNGKAWFKANTPAVGQFYAVAVDQAKPYNVYGGLQDNGVWTGPSTYVADLGWYDSGQYPYKFILGGDGMQVQVDPRDNNTVYSGFQFGNYYRIDKTTGKTSETKPKHALGEKPLRFNWQAPIWLSVHNPDILYMGSNKLHRSLDQGDHFTALSGDLTRGGRVGDVPYGTLSSIHESPMKFGLLYTGSDDGLIHVTKDGGATWTRISDALPQHLRVNRVQASAHVEGRVYAVLSGFQWDHFAPYIFVSEDFGSTWKRIGLDLPTEPVNVLREDPVNPDLLFVGTDNGLYTSLDRGNSFMRMSNGLPAVAVHDLVIQPQTHDLVVGTHGRSIYIANITILEQVTSPVLLAAFHLFDVENVRLKNNWDQTDGNWEQSLFASTQLNYFTRDAGVTRVRLLYKEKELMTLTDTSEAGVNIIPFNLSADSVTVNAALGNVRTDFTGNLAVFQSGAITLPPATYVLEVSSPKGVVMRQEVSVLPAAKR